MEDVMKTLKHTATLVAIVALAIAGTANAQLKISESETAKLYISLNTVGTAQALTQKNVYDSTGKPVVKLEPGMQTAFGDLGFLGKFGKKEEIEMYFDLYLASRNHPSTTYGDQGYLIVRGIPENLGQPALLKTIFTKVDFKAGAFLVDFGDQEQHRSNNAIVQKNPLIGNFVIDPNFVSVGVQLMSKPGRYGWLVAATNGTNTEDFQTGRGNALNAKIYAYPIKPLRTSFSFYTVNHDETPATNGSRATLFSGNRSGERYGAVLGGGQAPGGVLPGAGKAVTAGQFDITFDSTSPIKLYGHYGMTRDADTNGSAAGKPEESWRYYAGDVVYKFTPAIYAAARYSAADAMKLNNINSNGKVDRIQFGGGLWLTKNLLVKVEYVTQKYRGFRSGDMVNNGIQAWRDPSFKGIVSEVSFAF
jgi:hypothetical protein